MLFTMKKTLLISCALLLTAVGASAQITDVTATYIQNPSFETNAPTGDFTDGGRGYSVAELTGWTLTNASNFEHIDLMTKDATETDNNLGTPGEAADGTYMLYLKKTWSDPSSTASIKQTLTLPAGTYMLTVDSKCFSGGASANLVAGSASNAITINGTSAGSETSHPMDELTEWTTNELTFTVTPEEGAEEAEVSIGVEFTLTNTSPGSFVLDNFMIYSVVTDYDVSWQLANPSFEVDNVVANLTVDTGRSIKDEDGNLATACAWSVTSLTGWTLPTLSGATYGVSDLMTSGATSTDNNFGVPGDPSAGTYMLYIRDAWQSDEDVKLTQELTLPAGVYKITVDTKCVANGSTATLFVGEESTALTIHSTSNGTNDTASNPFLDAWDTAELIFSLETEATVSVGVEFDFGTNGSFLLDNFKLYSVAEIEKEITWTMTEAGWGTMILPFAADVPDGLTLYDGDALTIDESTITVGDASESIVANTPYLVKGTEGSYSFSGTPTNEGEIHTTGVLTGTLVDLAVGKGAAFATDGTMYLLQNHEGDVAFYPITTASAPTEDAEGASLDAYHCYLTIAAEETEGAETAKLSIVLPGVGEETGIVAVEGAEAEANDAIYDLSGRRVAKAVKGVYIQNGKKVLVR